MFGRAAILLAFLAVGLEPAGHCQPATEKQRPSPRDGDWRVLTSGGNANLRGLSAAYAYVLDADRTAVIWASGSNGMVLRSSFSGRRWTHLRVPEGEHLDFRGIQAFTTGVTYVISSGEGEQSRIYKTANGGANWKLQYTGSRKEIFLDAIVCLSASHCLALSDPVDGKFLLLETKDGANWKEMPHDGMPSAIKGEGAFAASGTSLAACGDVLLFGTGGPAAHVFRSSDSGASWSAAPVPVAFGNASSGVFSLACRGARVVAVGGDYQKASQTIATAAYSTDGGVTWAASTKPPSGYRSAVAALDEMAFLATGPTGTDFSSDGGEHWRRISEQGFNALFVLGSDQVLAAGAGGTVAWLVAPK